MKNSMKLCGSEMLKIQEKSSKNVEKSKKEALPGLCRLLQPKSLPGKAFVASLEQNKRWPAVYDHFRPVRTCLLRIRAGFFSNLINF